MSIEAIAESSAVSMTDDQIKEFLTEEGVGILAFPDEELPYLVPMSFGFDGSSTLYFIFLLFGSESRKETLATHAEKGRFLVYRAESLHDWQSVSISGRVDSVDDDEWDALRNAMQNAWHPDIFSSASPMRGVEGYHFQIDEWTGIQHGSPTA
ncbi:pyridoxamine 5'-phosphate oxidase family protein [Halocatena pleomorpha]|uniref:Pyridoxamine 5'-phosphate oxidase family protein n=1 Tax=Halocatena pleomorpha TaxID=1785090 RepID=A0A3P3R868_9EURY|nr:pyridoxamine 5'-phosphate oxidase family protein [Halocatena pleomorpha]RRJ29565.1 pyridoxamine 5'-phosphate oxidase family protein [Halocatena pleomorpha]